VRVVRSGFCATGWTRDGNQCRGPCPSGSTWNSTIRLCEFPPEPDPERGGGGEPCDDAGGGVGPMSGNNISVADPIHIGTGNVFYRETDLVLAGGLLSFSRYYNSSEKPTENYSMRNWRADFLFRKAIVVTYAGSVATAKVTRPDGRNILYTAGYNSSTGRITSAWTPATAETHLRLTTVQPPSSGAWTALEITAPGGIVETYNKSPGALTKISDAFGVLYTFTRESSGKLTRIDDRYGNVLAFTYTSSGTPVALASLVVNGTTWATYQYTGDKLTSVTYADGSVRTYRYEDPVFSLGLSAVINENGEATASWSYDQDARAVRNSLCTGVMNVQVAYNADGTITETLPSGVQNTYTLGGYGGRSKTTSKVRVMGGQSATYASAYDGNGNLTQTTDWEGRITQYTYNSDSLEISRTEAYGTPVARTVNTTWDGVLRVPLSVSTPRLTTTYTYSNGRVATRTETDLTAWAGGSRTWAYTYNTLGQLVAVDGPRTGVADVTTYAYGSHGELLSVTNALGQQTQFSLHIVTGQPGRLVDANGIVTDLSYDLRGRLQSATLLDPVNGSLATGYTYDAAGNITRVVLPDGSALDYTYNPIGQVLSVEDGDGNRIEYTRDAEGNVTRQDVRDAYGALVRRVDQVWDGLRRLTTLAGVVHVRATYGYDAAGNLVSAANGLGQTTLRAFDALNRLASSTDPLNAVTQFGYDTADHLASVTDAEGLSTTYSYDGFGNLRRLVSPDTGTTNYAYDAAGNLVSRTDARGITVTFAHDALNRRVQADYPGTEEDIDYVWDGTAGGNIGVGRLTAISDGSGGLARTYDARGLVVSETRTLGGQNHVIAYAWDGAGRLSGITYPGGREVSYTRDADGRVTQVQTRAAGGAWETVLSGASWQPFGPVSSFTWGNGLSHVAEFDADGRVTRVATPSAQDRRYTWDAGDRIALIEDWLHAAHGEEYAYDAEGRLTAAQGAYGTVDWAYDGIGNRLSEDGPQGLSTYGYGVSSHRLFAVAGAEAQSFDYDNAGHAVAHGDWTLAYNHAGRLVSAAHALTGVSLAYEYNALGQRVRKTVDDNGAVTETRFLYDLDGHLIAETDTAGALLREYLWLGDTPVGFVAQAQGASGRSLFFVHADHLDTARVITDAGGQVAWQALREPFGATTVLAGNTLDWPLRFPGQYLDSEMGWHYNYFRDYDPQTGRYIESDPIGLRGGINTYAYVGGNPVVFSDPYGLVRYGDIKEIVTSWVPSVGPVDAASAVGAAQEGLHSAQDVFGPEGGVDDIKDAYRHCVWSCEMAKRIGPDQAETIGDAHEQGGSRNSSPGSAGMDTSNNRTGRACADISPDKPCSQTCLQVKDVLKVIRK
jgi:RHS repeat-associated protein